MYQIYVGCDWHLYSNKYNAHHPYRTARSIGRLADNYGYMIDDTDIFIFLGDLCDLQVCDRKKLAQVSSVIHNIKGYKIMCKGNHDLFDDDVYLELGFDEICDIATAYGLVFSHVPVRVMPNEVNIHAHLHHEKVSSLGYQHINAYSANFQKEDQPILVDTLLKEAPIQDIDYNEKWSKEVTEQFKQYTAIHDNMLHSKIIDISDKIPLYPVDEASAEMNEILFPDTDSTKYWEADDDSASDHEFADDRKPNKMLHKNDVVAESSSRLRVYTKPLYRITYDDIGIYEAYKKACSFDEWRSFINSDAATWLDVPKIYNRDINHTSYFTKRGYELFQKNTYPVIIQKLNKRNIKVDQVVLDVKPVYKDLYQVVVPNPVDESVYDQNKGYRAIAYDKNLHPIELKSTLHENISFTNSFPITALDELLQEIIDYDDINDPLHEGTLMYDIFDNSNGNKYTLTSKDCIELLSSTNIFAESSSGIVVDLTPLVGKNMGKKTILSKDIFDNFLRIAPEALDKEKIKTARDAQDLIDMFNKMCMKAINDTYKHDEHFSNLDSYTAGFHILAMIYAYNGGTITKKALKKVSPNLFPLDLEGPEFESYIRDVIDQLTKVEAFYIDMVEYTLTFIGFGYADSVNALKNLDGPNAIKMAKKYVDKNKAEFTKTYADGTIQYDFRHIHLNHVYIAPNLATDTGYANRIKPSRYIERAKRFDYCIFAHADSYIENGKQMWTIPGGITIDGKQFVNMEDIVKYLNPRKHRILIMSCNPGHIEPNGEVFNNNVEYAGNDVILESSDIHQLNVRTLLKKWLDYTKHGIKRLNKIEEQILTIIDELKLIVAPDAIQLMYGFKLDREEDITPKELRQRFADSIETSISTYMEFLLSSRIIARALMDKLNGTLITECTKGYGWAYSYNGSISTLPESTHTQLYPAVYRYPDKDTMFEDMALAELIPEVSTTINPLIKNEQISDCRFDYVDYTEQSSSDDKYYPTYHNIPESDWPNETALFIQTPHRNISTVESSLTESSVVRTQILGENLTLDSYRSDDIALQINGTKYKIKAKDILDDYINVSPEDIADCREEEIRSIDDLSDRLYKVLQSYGKHYEESCAGAKSLYNLMMIATDSNDPFSKPENKKLFRMMVEYFLPKGITDKQFNDLVHTRMRELKDIEYYLIKLLETNIALFGLEVTEVNALAMSSDRKKVIKDIKCRVDEQADKITDHRSSCTVYDFNQLYAGINCRVYIGNQLIHDAEQRGISTTPSRFLIRARKYDHIIATHAIANVKYDYEIQPIVMDNGTKVTTVNALLKELSLQNAKNVLLLICNPNAIDLDPIIDRYRMNVDYINPDSDGEGIIAIYESSANTALKYMSIMDELDSWNTRLKTTRKSIDHMECDLYDYMERYGYLTAPEKIYFAKLNANTSHPIQVKDKTSIKYENYIKLRGYGVHLAFTYLKTLLYVTKLFIKYALHRYDRLVTEHASGYQAIMRNQLQMFDQEDQIATFSIQNKSYITESCICPEDYLYQSMTELREDIELYHWANTDNMMIQESSVKEYNRTDDNKPIRDRKESKEYAEKYGIRPIGQEEPDEKSSEEIERMKKAKQLQHARAIKKRKKIVNKVKQHLPFVKNEDATAVDNSDIMELDIEHSPLYGDRKHFFYNYDMPKETNTSAEKLDEMAYEDYCDYFYMKLKSLASEYNKRDDIFKRIAKILKMDQDKLPKFDCHIEVSSEKQLCFSMINPDTPFEIKCEYEKYLKEMITELEKDKETKDKYPYVTSIWTADAEGSIYINLDYKHINESAIQESYQFEFLDKNVHFYDKMDEAASYQAKGKLYPVYVMLVHSGTTVSNLIKTISHSEYSHASISFDSSLDHMYSFARKDPKNPFLGGFRYESIGKGFYDKKEIPYALYVVPCTEDQVKRMKKRLDYFVKNNSKLSFDFAGLVKNYIGYADEPEYRWFCSRFVADILNAGSPEEFKYIDEPSLMDPDDFKKTNFARFVISGDNMMEYDRKLVDKLTKKILIEEKHRKQTGYTLAEDVIDPTIPYEDDILVYQLLTMDESVVDDVLNYLQSFKIKFDQDGNVIIHQREYKELSQHFNKSKRMLRHYRKTGATESIKNELCKLYYMINIIETYYLKPATDEKYKERQKQMMDLRALMINVFRQNLNEVTAKEPNFNFQSYYNASDYGKDLKIPKTVIAATGKALITMLS